MSVQTRGRLLRAAKKVFSEKGYYNAQISHIIDTAGVARGTFYLYFKSKEEILKEILKEVVSELRVRIKVIDLKRDPVDQIVENIQRVLDFALEEKELARIVLQRNCDPKLFSTIEEFFDEVTSMVENSLRKGIDLGLLRECDTSVLAKALIGAVKEVIVGLLDKKDVDTKKVARDLVDLGLRGIWKGGESYGGFRAV